MSRVFSLLGFCGPRLGFGGGRGPGLIVAVSKKAPGLASFLAARTEPARKLSARSTDSVPVAQRAQLAMGSGASAGECAAAAAGECVFGSVFADMAPPGTALLWPCLLMPMVKGMAAGHQQALAAQAEQRRIRGR